MPIYEYQCDACCHCFEEFVFSSEPRAPVPQVRLRGRSEADVGRLRARPGNPHRFRRVQSPLLQALRRLTDLDLPPRCEGDAF